MRRDAEQLLGICRCHCPAVVADEHALAMPQNIGCGALTVVFRYFGLFPEGVTYAILIMNVLVWIIDYYTPIRRFGTRKGGAAKCLDR